MLNITVNKDKIFEYKEENGKKFLNDIFLNADIQPIGEGQYHALYKGLSYRLECLDKDGEEQKEFKIKINGKLALVSVKDRNDLILAKMGLSSSNAAKTEEIKAPMPGLVIDIKVAEGDMVKAGDPLLVLEAMKMENSIKSPCDGQVKSILSKKGDIVEKNKVLIKFH
jgi:biotin carboxyl carrier protein